MWTRPVHCPALGLARSRLCAFFDHDPNTALAPEPPTLNAFDRQVLTLCGTWGAPIAATDFERLLLEPAQREILSRIGEALHWHLYSPATEPAELVRQLRRAWFEQKGFKHIFCGEPDDRGLGGLHFAPRYLQAQEQGWAGLAANATSADQECQAPPESSRPPIFMVSVAFQRKDQSAPGIKCRTSYHQQLHAEDLLIAATQALQSVLAQPNSPPSTSCQHWTERPGVAAHQQQLIVKRQAIRSFYPLLKSRCDRKGHGSGACSCQNL